ncbi:MAG: hypothetical protein H7Y27_10500 [Gemmatimonadaceae bacterium]|nr:hypothetical protein [Chitinophagaceae bacterium]
MLLAIEMTLSVFTLTGIILIALFVGFMLRAAQLSRIKQSNERLENEMLSNHAEILKLQKELADKTSVQSRTPIVPMRESVAETNPEKLPESGSRKKFLG